MEEGEKVKVATVPMINCVEGWSEAHPDADIKRVEPISYKTCGTTLTSFVIYYDEKAPIPTEARR